MTVSLDRHWRVPITPTAAPGVSVIIPAYNAERYLSKAIESVLRQTYPGVVQIIVVDDGSQDRTLSVAADYKGQVTVIKKTNGGVSSARNTGLNASFHELVALLDSDDTMREDRLAAQCNALRATPAALLCCSSAEFIGEDDKPIEDQPKCLDPALVRGVDLTRRLLHRNFITTSSVMFRRSAVMSMGGFNEAMQHSEDLDLWLRLSTRGGLIVLPAPLVKYRQHGAQSIHNTLAMAKGRFEARLNFLRQFPEARKRVGTDAVSKEIPRYAESYGWGLVMNGEGGQARRVYRQALRYVPLHPRLWRLFASSFVYPKKRPSGL